MRGTDTISFWAADAAASSSTPRGRWDAPTEVTRSRSRSTSPKPLPFLHSEVAYKPRVRISSVSLHQGAYQAHHQLPDLSSTPIIPSDPILFLPPLLSPLPSQINDDAIAIDDFNTRLPHIDPASLALHQTLHFFRPSSDKYASTPYNEAFNWSSLNLPANIYREWYCVVFRSRRKPSSSSLSLYRADREAHEEAVHNGGLIMYWYGVPDESGLNLATCIWQSRKHAINAISGPKHVKAMREAKDAYEIYELERWILSKDLGERGLRLRKWEGGEVGW
ncbi:hypothetical protein P7C73_g4284, partial [Tremellales sp. Uapishka_1]